ncbi:MAG: DUF4345 domain-containing protein [Lysobacteraceae bacterium]
MRTLSRLTLWLAGLGFLGFGIACLIAPVATLAAAGMEVAGAVAATELRAFYGGLEIGLGLFIVATALSEQRHRAGLWLCLAAYGGIGLARALGMALDGISTTFLCSALAVELALALLAALCLWRSPRAHRARSD